MKRKLYEYREKGVVNLREVELEANGDLHLGGHDLDPALEGFVGDSEWEGDLVVRAAHVPTVLEALQKELGPKPLLGLVVQKFGGSIQALTQFEEWLKTSKIPYEFSSWS
jgi:hypothetical protein